jgi:uncharacterized membrane protein
MNPPFLLLILFLIYGLIGWILDTGFRSLVVGRFVAGVNFPLPQWVPLRPMYAVGAAILILLEPFYIHLSLAFQMLFIGILLTTYEYLTGVLSEKMSGKKLWDYSYQRFNFQGRISLLNSTIWAMLGVLFIHLFHPWVMGLISNIPLGD